MPVKKRGHPTGLMLHDQWRARIKAGEILNRLKRHVDGECKMLPTQVKAAEILLRKCMPDLSHTELSTPNGPLGVTIVSFADLKYDDDGNPILNGGTNGKADKQGA